jgi:hypothetical protein
MALETGERRQLHNFPFPSFWQYIPVFSSYSMVEGHAVYFAKNYLSVIQNETPIQYPYTLHEHQLEHADKAKYLGVTIQSDLKWDSHINNITTKAKEKLGFLH